MPGRNVLQVVGLMASGRVRTLKNTSGCVTSSLGIANRREVQLCQVIMYECHSTLWDIFFSRLVFTGICFLSIRLNSVPKLCM